MPYRHLDRSWMYELVRARALVLAVMYLAGAVTCVISGWILQFPTAPHGTYRGLAVLGFVLAALLMWRGERLKQWALHIVIALYSLSIGLLALIAAREVAVISLGPAVIAVAIYAGYFLIGRAMYLQVALVGIAFAVGSALCAHRPPLASVFSVVLAAICLALILNRLTQELRRRSTVDNLTGVATRSAWMEIARRTLISAGPGSVPMTVAIIDMDNFKLVNDEDGHLAGDRLLQDVTRAWRGSIAASTLVGRFGGDEFVVLFPATRYSAAQKSVDVMVVAHPARWTAGIAEHRAGESVSELLHRADQSLIDAKQARKRSI